MTRVDFLQVRGTCKTDPGLQGRCSGAVTGGLSTSAMIFFVISLKLHGYFCQGKIQQVQPASFRGSYMPKTNMTGRPGWRVHRQHRRAPQRARLHMIVYICLSVYLLLTFATHYNGPTQVGAT
jgi:hypothetical protein